MRCRMHHGPCLNRSCFHRTGSHHMGCGGSWRAERWRAVACRPGRRRRMSCARPERCCTAQVQLQHRGQLPDKFQSLNNNWTLGRIHGGHGTVLPACVPPLVADLRCSLFVTDTSVGVALCLLFGWHFAQQLVAVSTRQPTARPSTVQAGPVWRRRRRRQAAAAAHPAAASTSSCEAVAAAAGFHAGCLPCPAGLRLRQRRHHGAGQHLQLLSPAATSRSAHAFH